MTPYEAWQLFCLYCRDWWLSLTMIGGTYKPEDYRKTSKEVKEDE